MANRRLSNRFSSKTPSKQPMPVPTEPSSLTVMPSLVGATAFYINANSTDIWSQLKAADSEDERQRILQVWLPTLEKKVAIQELENSHQRALDEKDESLASEILKAALLRTRSR